MTTTPTYHPLILPGPQAQAAHEGRLTEHRVALDPQPLDVIGYEYNGKPCWVAKTEDNPSRGKLIYPRLGNVGDRLFVQEEWWHRAPSPTNPRNEQAYNPQSRCVVWPTGERIEDCKPDTSEWGWKERDPAHMPRWASRTTLEIVAIRVERLQEISEEGAGAQGYPWGPGKRASPWKTAGEWFAFLWDSLNDNRGFGWDVNPWVWVPTLKRLEAES